VQGRNIRYVTLQRREAAGAVDPELRPLCTYRHYHAHVRGGWSLEVATGERGCRVTATVWSWLLGPFASIPMCSARSTGLPRSGMERCRNLTGVPQPERATHPLRSKPSGGRRLKSP
jgi:hypothetical protein